MKKEIIIVVANFAVSIKERGLFSGFGECLIEQDSVHAFYAGIIQKTF
jgi:hypothetical protein